MAALVGELPAARQVQPSPVSQAHVKRAPPRSPLQDKKEKKEKKCVNAGTLCYCAAACTALISRPLTPLTHARTLTYAARAKEGKEKKEKKEGKEKKSKKDKEGKEKKSKKECVLLP